MGFSTQFAYPQGFFGHVAGWLMSMTNKERNHWAVSLLEVVENDSVLEIGCGPGLALAQIAREIGSGQVIGVDPSEVMLVQARRRNAKFIEEESMKLVLAEAEQLPFEDGAFDKALAANSLQVWKDPAGGLREVRRVLKKGGLFLVVEEPRGSRSKMGLDAVASEIKTALERAGFRAILEKRRSLGSRTAVALRCMK